MVSLQRELFYVSSLVIICLFVIANIFFYWVVMELCCYPLRSWGNAQKCLTLNIASYNDTPSYSYLISIFLCGIARFQPFLA